MKWRVLKPSDFHIGHRLGEFSKTRILAVFRQKASRKKKPTASAANLHIFNAAKIERIRKIKSGQTRKPLFDYKPETHNQFESIS